MPSSRHKQASLFDETPHIVLDQVKENQYIISPSTGDGHMSAELFDQLENKINDLVARYEAMKNENTRLAEENHRLQQEREGLKGRIDAILGKLDGL